MVSKRRNIGNRASAVFLVGTILGGWSAPLLAQQADPLAAQPEQGAPAPAQTPPAAPTPAQTAPAQGQAPAAGQPAPLPPAPVARPAASGVIRSIAVRGSQRLEPETIRAYANLAPGQTYTAETLDAALKDLYATELFSDVVITGAETGAIVITVQENPVINRIILEGNKRIKDDKIVPEIKLKPREIFTRSKVRADVDRIIELYKRQGRFAARVEPKIVNLEQNRVDLVFEIYEGDKSKVRSINIIGNNAFGDDRLRKEMFTRQAGGPLGFLKSNDSYDPDRLAADQQKLRAFYLTQGYADFRVVSALAELTPDRRDFVITYVIEEGPRYKFGTVQAESALRDLPNERIVEGVKIKSGDWFNAKQVEDAVTKLSEEAGNLGYAFADINPSYDRDAEKRLMNITFRVGETPRVYVERIDIQGNTATRDKVIRREFRINEGDAFNALKVKRSQDRLQSLGFFQENLEIKQTEGSTPDRVVLGVNVEEKSTGELQLSAGYSSLEQFILSASIAQRNFMGKGQILQAGVNWSRYSKSIQLGIDEPYFLDKNILVGGDIFRQDYNSFNYIGNDRNTTYSQTSTGTRLRLGFPVNEYVSFGTRYSLVMDNITLDESTFFTDPDLVTDPDGSGPLTGSNGPLPPVCDPRKAGTYLCNELGKRLTSAVGYSVIFNNANGIHPTQGQVASFSQDFAGLGGDVKYIRTRVNGTKYWSLGLLGGGWVFSAHAEGGYIHPLEKAPGVNEDAVRITDRFFGTQLRGFDIRGIGPRVIREQYNSDGTINTDSNVVSDALGGRAYYMGRLELEFPVSSTLKSFGLRPSAFIDVGSVWNLVKPTTLDILKFCSAAGQPVRSIFGSNSNTSCTQFNTGGATGYADDATHAAPGYRESFVGNSARPRLSVGIGVNWVSPFGPLRIDLAKALMKQDGDETKLFSFNVGTQF
ncbi:outer membrane protein assembly factor BamA [Sphingomonas sp. SM33]|uniref:Outer membrane protein assembly factor BamA n=1 Tax=Sphingomonas telluris TaxID=2907998 RepID=A0ABS9VK71_9SPHN|nr:outer membrane protein assembly factor BamA [Sphingomonas telluris]